MTVLPTSFPADGLAVVIGASGGIGAALVSTIKQSGAFAKVLPLSRSGAFGPGAGIAPAPGICGNGRAPQ